MYKYQNHQIFMYNYVENTLIGVTLQFDCIDCPA